MTMAEWWAENPGCGPHVAAEWALWLLGKANTPCDDDWLWDSYYSGWLMAHGNDPKAVIDAARANYEEGE